MKIYFNILLLTSKFVYENLRISSYIREGIYFCCITKLDYVFVSENRLQTDNRKAIKLRSLCIAPVLTNVTAFAHVDLFILLTD